VRARGTIQEFSRAAAQRAGAVAHCTAGVSEVRIKKHQLGGQAADAAKLLAVHGMRRSLESEPADEIAERLVE
jgi:hypothetical protein